MRQQRHRVSIVLGWTVLLPVATLGRVPAAASQDVVPPTFGTDATVVLLDVGARDGKGRQVFDLRSEELRVRENGKDCKIVSVRLVGLKPPEVPRAVPAGAEGSAVATVPPIVAPAATPAVPARATLVVIVFDRLSTPTAGPAREAVLRLLSQQFPPDTWFAVFMIGHGTQLVQPFTSDVRRLENAVRLATPGADAQRRAEYVSPLPRTQEQDVVVPTAGPPLQLPSLREVAPELSGGEGALTRAVEGLDALHTLKSVARALQPVRGRKSILYVAEAWHLETMMRGPYDEAISAANRANATINVVDARGLTMAGGAPRYAPCEAHLYDDLRALRGARANDGPASRGLECRENTLRGPRLDLLAEDTGGIAIEKTNDLGAGLVRVVEELGHYYEIVYEPANPVPDGRFRRIAIATTRKGLQLRTRAGYYATPERAPTLSPHDLPLIPVLAGPTAPHDFPLQTGVLQFGVRGGEREGVIVADVPLSAVQIDSSDTAWRAQLTLLSRVKDEKGRVVGRLTDDRPLGGSPQDLEVARRGYVTFTSRMMLPPGNYELETAVQDVVSGQVGVARAPFRIERARKGLVLGSVTLVRSATAETEGSAGDDPLRIGDVRLVPAVSAQFAAVGELSLFVPIYPAEGTEPVRLTVELWSQGRLVTRAAPSLPPLGNDGRIAWLGGIPLASLPPGQYEVLIKARQGSSEVEDRAPFELVARSGS